MTLRFALEPSSTDEILYTQAGHPTLDLRFASAKSLTDQVSGLPLIDFTRGGNGVGTYVGSDGLIKNSVVNLLLQSEDFSTTWYNFNSSETVNAAVAPNGTLTADKLIPDVGVTNGLFRQDFSLSQFPNDVQLCCSVYVKAAEFDYVSLTFYNNANTFCSSGRLDLSQGVFDTSATNASRNLEPLGDGWYRLSIVFSSGSGSNAPNVRIVCSNTGDGTSGIYIWGAQVEQSSTVGEYVKTTSSISGAPRFDHDPTTGESLGLLVEESRTNSIRNNTMVGAVAGTPGTPPMNWSSYGSRNGLTQEIIGTGTEDGIAYIDIKWSGTTTSAITNGTLIATDATTTAVAASGQAWTSSTYIKLAAGSYNGLTLYNLGCEGFAFNQAYVEGSYISFFNTASRLIDGRVSVSRTFAGAVAFARQRFIFSIPNATAIDFTLRIGLPQLEQGAFATSVIPTSTAAVTRSADVASITGSNFSRWYSQSQGTLFADATIADNSTNRFIAAVSDGTIANEVALYWNAVFNSLVIDGGVVQANSFGGSTVAGERALHSFSYKLNDFQGYANSTALGADTSGTVPTVNQLRIGARVNGTFVENGTISRLVYFDRRLPNATLQSITSSTAPTTYGNLVLDSANTPQAIAGVAPTLDYRFARDRREIETVSLSDKLTYTGGNGTFVGSDGYIQQATTNVPRFDHDPLSRVSEGVLVEEQRTNLLEYSVDFSQWSFILGGNLIITPNAGTAPDGTNTATLIENNGITGYLGDATTYTSGITYTFSGYFKANDGDQVAILLYSSGGSSGFWNSETSNVGTVFDLTNGTFTALLSGVLPTASSITDAGNGWWRCSITATCTVSNGNDNQLFRNLNGGTEGIYAWGYQIEVGSFLTSYISTAGSTVTRTADSATIDGTGVLTGTYTMVAKPEGCAIESGGNIVLQEGYTTERVMVFPAALSAAQITAIRSAM